MRVRSMCRYSSVVVPGRTWAPLASTHWTLTWSPAAMWRRGGRVRSQTEWVGAAARE